MASKKGTLTGANLDNPNRGKKGGLTGSKRVTGETVIEESTSLLPGSDPEVATADANARANLAEKFQQTGQAIQQGVQVIGAVVNTASSAVQAVQRGIVSSPSPSTLTDGIVNTTGILAKATAEIDDSVPELDSAEATRRNIVIARQRNYLDVAINNTRLKQNLAQLDIEQQKLIGLLIDSKTIGINNEKKAVQYQRAVIGRDTELSKLEQDNELLTQQRIRTTGTQNQTEHITEQERLKVEKLKVEVEKQKYEIENLNYEKERIKQEAVAKFAAGF